MRDVQQVLNDLKALAQQRNAGHDVSHHQTQLIAELKEHGIVASVAAPPAAQPPALSQAQLEAAVRSVFAGRGGSRFTTDETAEFMKALESGQAQYAPTSSQPKATLAGVMTKALAEATPSAGGYLVPVEVSNEVMQLVRARISVMQMGPRVLNVAKELDLPAVALGTTAAFVQENARIPVSEPQFSLTPKLKPLQLAALSPVSNRLLHDAQTVPEFEEIIRSDLADAVANRADLAYLQGLGGGTEPLGLRNVSGINVVNLDPTTAPTLLDFRKVVATLRSRNCPFVKPGWIMHPDVLSWLEQQTDTDGHRLLDGEDLSLDAAGTSGTFLGFRFQTTTRIPTNLTVSSTPGCTYALFGDFNEVWIGEQEGLRLDASDTASYVQTVEGEDVHIHAFQFEQTLFKARTAVDICLRRPEWMVAMEGVKVS
ncbi:phage major capsid protein [Capillimicrobium parvum]|uniref:Phage capsid-like C-terminal domain-containing protein n=1 Tax=Capillimicrobium parvum TaxID=2884022 RepID=A0A9E7C112_9ACTN|nr:phage major capsid protein [Capillimicrobium parvum]UGS36102.1 hypothetical protein DSM104329_02500 [Capillimicrobium parvum]